MTSLSTNELADLTRHNREVWDRCATTYSDGFEALTGGASEILLDLAGVGRGSELLDIGTGPGTLIGPALIRGALVSAIDLAPGMVEQASARHPGVDIAIGDAASLPYDDGSFDSVTIGFCLHHAADPEAILREVNRILRPGGRLSFAVWASAEQLEAFGLAFGAVGESVPLDEVPSLQPPAIATEPPDYEQLLVRTGFTCPTARMLELVWPLVDGAAIFDGFDRFLDLGAQPEQIRTEIRQRLDRQISELADVSGVAYVPNPAIVAAASKR